MIEKDGFCRGDDVVFSAVDKIFAVEVDKGVVVDLVNKLIHFLLNSGAVFVGI